VTVRRPRKHAWKLVAVLVIAALAVAAWQTAGWWQRPPAHAPLPRIAVELAMPDRIGDRARNQVDELISAASAEAASLSSSAGVIDAKSAFYGTHEDRDIIYVVTWRSVPPSSAAVFDEVVEASSDSGGAETVHSETVEAGPLEG
jgi:hypothetical protein